MYLLNVKSDFPGQNERNRAGARFLAFMGEPFAGSKAIRQLARCL
jgi:hypothetical protein